MVSWLAKQRRKRSTWESEGSVEETGVSRGETPQSVPDPSAQNLEVQAQSEKGPKTRQTESHGPRSFQSVPSCSTSWCLFLCRSLRSLCWLLVFVLLFLGVWTPVRPLGILLLSFLPFLYLFPPIALWTLLWLRRIRLSLG